MTQQEWTTLLHKAGAAENFEHFGDLAADLTAANNGTVVAPLLDTGVIRASGEDTVSFLNNLLSNDIKNLNSAEARHAGFCTPKGRLLASFVVAHDQAASDDFLLLTSAEILPTLLKRLSMFVFRSKVKLTDASAERVLIGLAGPQAVALLREIGTTVPEKLKTAAIPGGQVIALDEQRFILALDPTSAIALWPKLSAQARPVGLNAWHALQIAAGEPNVVAATQEMFIPQMVNYELLGGVSFKKGCYPGQEIVARTQHLGKIKRRMYRASVAALAAPGTDLFAPETGAQSCGNVVSSASNAAGGSECLVVLQSSCQAAGEVRLGSVDGPLLSFLALPYSLE